MRPSNHALCVMKNPVYIPTCKQGFSHPKCYLAYTKGCSQQISGEHYISRALLDQIEKQNKTIDITGLSWLPKEQLTSIGKAGLVSNILCADHNSALSPLDGTVTMFVKAIEAIDKDFQTELPGGPATQVDGELLERWILKMTIAMVVSRQILQPSGAPFIVKEKAYTLLCEPEARWPRGWGLYFSLPIGPVHHSSSFEAIPKHDPSTGALLEMGLKFNGLAMTFLMGRPGNAAAFGTHRPSVLQFAKGAAKSEIRFSWGHKAAGSAIQLTHVGMYKGVAPGQDLPRSS